MLDLTPEEEKFIRTLRRAVKNIPERLWLFCSEGGLHVMAKGEDGARVWDGDAIDQNNIIANITDDITSGSW